MMLEGQKEQLECDNELVEGTSASLDRVFNDCNLQIMDTVMSNKSHKSVNVILEKPNIINMDEDKAADGGWGWFVVLGSFIVHIIMGGFERSGGIFYLQFLKRFDKSATSTVWVLSLFSTIRLVMGPLASALCNRFSCRFVVMLGSLICSIGVLISAFMPDLPYLYLTYGVLGGLGRALIYAPSLIIVGYYFNKRRGIAVGLSTSGVGIGSFIFPPLIEISFTYYGFSGTFLILAAVACNFCVCGALFRPIEINKRIMELDRKKLQRLYVDQNETLLPLDNCEMPTRPTQQILLTDQHVTKQASAVEIAKSHRTSLLKRKISSVKSALIGSDSGSRKKPLFELSLFRNFAFTTLCVQTFLYTISFNTTFVFLPALAKERNISQLYSAYLMSIIGISDAISRIIMSIILDLKAVKPYRLIIYNIVMFLTAVVSWIIPPMNTFISLAIVCAIYGVLTGTYIAQKSVVVIDILGMEKLSNSVGFLLMFQGLSALVGPIIGGMFKDFLGSYDVVFYFGSIGIVIGGFIMVLGNVWLYRQKKMKNEEKEMECNENTA